ncbi:MAG: hypothetical protein A2X99_09975 [Deltaproteobacteria bacterium GWB2_55_19]|nr:MAG: hypothetical protein A2X99_09975 [Deltaproteobacteria bacterium GWB2_55_19]
MTFLLISGDNRILRHVPLIFQTFLPMSRKNKKTARTPFPALYKRAGTSAQTVDVKNPPPRSPMVPHLDSVSCEKVSIFSRGHIIKAEGVFVKGILARPQIGLTPIDGYLLSYLDNHFAGVLMIAANIMGIAEAVSPGSTIAEALSALKDAAVVPVVDNEGRLVGQIDARDLLKGLAPSGGPLGPLDGVAGFEKGKVEDVMERAFAFTGPDSDASSLMALMEAKKSLSVFIVDDGMRLLGRVTPMDILERLWEFKERKGR